MADAKLPALAAEATAAIRALLKEILTGPQSETLPWLLGVVQQANDYLTPKPPVFILRATKPTPENTGPRYPLTAWQGASSVIGTDRWDAINGVLTVNTLGATYERIDFGSAWVDVRASNVTFRDTKFTNTKATPFVPFARSLVSVASDGVRNLLVEHTEFTNAPAPGVFAGTFDGAVGSHDYTLNRVSVRGFTDCARIRVGNDNPFGDVRVVITGCYLSEMSWWWDAVKGRVHPSDVDSHPDAIQWEGGKGTILIGNVIGGYLSETVGTFDTAANGNIRTALVGAKAISLSAMMLTGRTNLGTVFDGIVEDNWIGGGSYTVNAGSDLNTGTVGRWWRNRFARDSFQVGKALVVQNGVLCDDGAGTANRNVWVNDDAELKRGNG